MLYDLLTSNFSYEEKLDLLFSSINSSLDREEEIISELKKKRKTSYGTYMSIGDRKIYFRANLLKEKEIENLLFKFKESEKERFLLFLDNKIYSMLDYIKKYFYTGIALNKDLVVMLRDVCEEISETNQIFASLEYNGYRPGFYSREKKVKVEEKNIFMALFLSKNSKEKLEDPGLKSFIFRYLQKIFANKNYTFVPYFMKEMNVEPQQVIEFANLDDVSENDIEKKILKGRNNLHIRSFIFLHNLYNDKLSAEQVFQIIRKEKSMKGRNLMLDIFFHTKKKKDIIGEDFSFFVEAEQWAGAEEGLAFDADLNFYLEKLFQNANIENLVYYSTFGITKIEEILHSRLAQ